MSNIRIGVDLGGTKIEAAALDSSGKILAKKRVGTPQNDYWETLKAIAELVTGIEQTVKHEGTIGIGMPGSFSKTSGLVKNANSTWLNDQPFDADLQHLMQREIRFANDANCLALSEATDGAGKGFNTVFAIILGTGVGGGIAIDQKVYEGANNLAGEWGHTPQPWLEAHELPGDDCYCGRSGCIETFLSGPGFSRDFAKQTGQQLKPEEIIAQLNLGQNAANDAFYRYQNRLAAAIAQLANILDPDIFVLGGGMSNIAPLYLGLYERIESMVFGGEFTTPIKQAQHGDSSGVRGAAWLW